MRSAIQQRAKKSHAQFVPGAPVQTGGEGGTEVHVETEYIK